MVQQSIKIAKQPHIIVSINLVVDMQIIPIVFGNIK